MKVIKEGKWHVPWSDELTCKTCEAVLLVEEADVHATDYDSYGSFHATCMVCGRSIPVPAKDLPLRLKDALEKKRKRSTYCGRD